MEATLIFHRPRITSGDRIRIGTFIPTPLPQDKKIISQESCRHWCGGENRLLPPNDRSSPPKIMGGNLYLSADPVNDQFRGGIIVHPFHRSRYDTDEEVLPFGVEMFARILDRYLELELF